MWSVLKKKMTKSGGYEMSSDRESDSSDDCFVILKKYKKIPSYAEGLGQETTRYENPYEIDTSTSAEHPDAAEPPPAGSSSSPSTTNGTGDVIRVTATPTDHFTCSMTVAMNPSLSNRTAEEREGHEGEGGDDDDAENNNRGARPRDRRQDENANGTGGGYFGRVQSTLSSLKLEEELPREKKMSPPRMKRREKATSGSASVASGHELRHSKTTKTTDSNYQNIVMNDPLTRKKRKELEHPPLTSLQSDVFSSNSEDETLRCPGNHRLPRMRASVPKRQIFPSSSSIANSENAQTKEDQLPGNRCHGYSDTMESGYLTLEDIRAQLEQAKALSLFRDVLESRSNDSRYDGSSEGVTSEADARDSEPTSGDVRGGNLHQRSSEKNCKKKEEQKARGEEEEEERSSDDNSIRYEVLNDNEPEKPEVKVKPEILMGVRQPNELPSSSGSTISGTETEMKLAKSSSADVRGQRSSQEVTLSEKEPEQEPPAAEGEMMMSRSMDTQDPVVASGVQGVCGEPIHMSWDELLQEAQILGIPLYRPSAAAAAAASSSLYRSDSERRSSMSSSATSSDLSHASPLHSPKMTRLASAGGGPWVRKDTSFKRLKTKSADKKVSPFRGKFKLQNLFAAKKALMGDGQRKGDRDPATKQRAGHSSSSSSASSSSKVGPQSKSIFGDSASQRSSNRVLLREFPRGESPVLHHYRSGPPSLRSSERIPGPGHGQGQGGDLGCENDGFRNSSISLRSHVLSSSYSSGSLGSVYSRSSSQTPSSSSTSYGKTSASGESPLTPCSTSTSGSGVMLLMGRNSPTQPLSHHVIHHVSGNADKAIHQTPSSAGNTEFISGLRQLKNCGWYWGPLSLEEAGQKLGNLPDGSFLVRDSSDDRYILSLSFRSQGLTHHTRIEHYKGVFSFYSQPKSHAASNIVEFIERAMEQSKRNEYLYFLRPRVTGFPPVPVQLLLPVCRLKSLPSLKHICRANIRGLIERPEVIDQLPLTSSLKRYIKESNI